MITEHPEQVAAVVGGQDLVRARAEQIAMGDGGRNTVGLRQAVAVVDLQVDVVALVDVVLDRSVVAGDDAAVDVEVAHGARLVVAAPVRVVRHQAVEVPEIDLGGKRNRKGVQRRSGPVGVVVDPAVERAVGADGV